MSDRGRGRSRGRARGYDERRPQPQAPGPREPQSAQPPQPSAWGRRPGHPTQPAPSTQTPYSRQMQQQSKIHPPVKSFHQSGGRALHRPGGGGDGAPGTSAQRGPEPMEVVPSVSGGGDASMGRGAMGRGAMRGKRILPSEILETKPKNLVTKKGTTGQQIMLQSNYFKLLTTTDWCLYQYRVDFSPEEDRTMVRKGLLKLHKEKIGAYIFDGTVLYTSHRLPDHVEFWSIRQSDDTKIRIEIRLVGDMMKGDHNYIQFFNIIMRKCLDLLRLQLVGRDYYDARSKVEIREFGLELWPGYLTSIRQHEHNILMCAEITHKVMRQETLLDILNDCYDKDRARYRELYERTVTGLVVLTDYNNNTYRITSIDFDATPSSSFMLKNGEQITYKDYYFNKYQIRIRNYSQPMLVTETKARDRRAGQPDFLYLVPELCRATGLTDNQRENFHLTSALAEHTRVSPEARINKLMNFNRRLRSEESISKELTEWNLKLDDKLIDIPARVLPTEKIVLGNNIVVSAGQFADWKRDLQTKPLFSITRLSQWVVVCTNFVRSDVESFVRTLKECARGMGCRIDDPTFFDIRDDRPATYANALELIMSKSNPELIFCVVMNNRTDRYKAIKKKCVVDRPVPSQVFLKKNLTSRGVRSIATKVAIQLNCKLGGAPWSVELPNIDLMVVGFDVCHDTANKGRDFGAMVASLNKSLTRYFSAVSAHTNGEELSNELSVNLTKALHNYRQINNKLPSHILIYRDGVGEGQIPYVFEHEVGQLRTKLKDIYGDQSLVKMAFVLVTKRINTRFFYQRNNPPPGTVIDDIVTNPVKYDFFIVSQNVQRGTVTPTAYSVIADTIGWRADQLQRMTYKMTHMYYNWSGTLRVPAPCQYAHKLAFLVAQYVHAPPSMQMQDLLYYL